MAERSRVLIIGGYGVFGRLLARELLATTDAQLVLSGRDVLRATAVCRALGAGDRATAANLDAAAPDDVARAAAGCAVVACAAGPFQALPRASALAAVRAGAHWLDIADDADWIGGLLGDPALADATSSGRTVGPGLSTVPALSGALVGWCHDRLPGAIRARVTLFIGNRNAKGAGALASALAAGLDDPCAVDLATGRRVMARRFRFPDPALLAGRSGVDAELRVAFESELVGRMVAALARLASRLAPDRRRRLARLVARAAAPTSWLGSDLGCLQAELWDDRGGHIRAAFVGRGQRMAVLPCALVAEMLLSGESHRAGLVAPSSWLTAEQWIALLQARGLRFIGPS